MLAPDRQALVTACSALVSKCVATRYIYYLILTVFIAGTWPDLFISSYHIFQQVQWKGLIQKVRQLQQRQTNKTFCPFSCNFSNVISCLFVYSGFCVACYKVAATYRDHFSVVRLYVGPSQNLSGLLLRNYKRAIPSTLQE